MPLGARAREVKLSQIAVPCLDTQSHDRVDNIIVILLQRLDGLIAADVGLGHDQLNVFILETLGINLFAVVLVVVLLGLGRLNSLAGLAVVVTSVVVGTGGGKLLGGSLLGRGVDVLNLGLAKDTALLVRFCHGLHRSGGGTDM